MCVCVCVWLLDLPHHCICIFTESNSLLIPSEPSRQVQELSRDQPFARCTSSSARCNWKGDLTPCLAAICSLQIHRTAVSDLLRTEAWSAPAFSGTATLRSHGVQPAARPASKRGVTAVDEKRTAKVVVEGGRGCLSQIVECCVCPLSSCLQRNSWFSTGPLCISHQMLE